MAGIIISKLQKWKLRQVEWLYQVCVYVVRLSGFNSLIVKLIITSSQTLFCSIVIG